MTVAIVGLKDFSQVVALTPNATGCESSLAGTLCTLTVPGLKPCPSKASCYAATIATYDAVTGCPSACAIPSGAHELSANQNVPFTIARGTSNQIALTLDGIPTSVTMLPISGLSGDAGRGFTIGGCGTSGALEVFGLDADNNIILGAGAPAPTLTSSNTAYLTVSGASASSPNAFTVSSTQHGDPNGVVQLSASVAPGSGSSSLPQSANVNVTIGLCGVFVTDTTNNLVKEIVAVDGSIPATPTISTLASGFNGPAGIAVDAAGNLYVNDNGNNAVKEILAVGGSIPPSPTIDTLGSGFSLPRGVAVDAAGNVYVADFNHNAIKEILAVGGSIPPSPTINTLGSGFASPQGVAVDGAGNVYVADSGHNAVKEMLAVNGSVPASPTISTLGSGFSGPAGVAVDSAGNVYVADNLNNAVKEMLAVNGSIPVSPTINTLGSGFSGPQAVAIDGAGNVYVADTLNNAVKEIVAVNGSIPASPLIVTLSSGFRPLGVAVR